MNDKQLRALARKSGIAAADRSGSRNKHLGGHILGDGPVAATSDGEPEDIGGPPVEHRLQQRMTPSTIELVGEHLIWRTHCLPIATQHDSLSSRQISLPCCDCRENRR